MKLHDVDQNTDEWMTLRAGKPTASAAKQLTTSTGAPSKSMPAYAQELAGELYAGRQLDTWEGNKYTQYGHETEEEARLAYAISADGPVTEGGFVTSDDESYGCSPDGFVGKSGLLEIKCLPKKHIDMLLYWKANQKCPPDFFAQVQFQLLVCERGWNDLFFYRPFLPSLAIRVFRDDEFIAKLQSQIAACLTERDRVLAILREF